MQIYLNGKNIGIYDLNKQLQAEKAGNLSGNKVSIDHSINHQELSDVIHNLFSPENTKQSEQFTVDDLDNLRSIVKYIKEESQGDAATKLQEILTKIKEIKKSIKQINASAEKTPTAKMSSQHASISNLSNQARTEQVASVSLNQKLTPGLVGVAMIVDSATSEKVPMEICCRSTTGREIEIIAYHAGEKIGDMSIINFDRGEINGFNSYGTFIQDISKKVYVNTVNAPGNKQFKGIGSALMQVAYEISLHNGAEGKVVLLAQYQSGGFYHKLGLRCLSDNLRAAAKIDQKIEECIQKGNRWETNEKMYLPVAAMEEFDRKVVSEPILEVTKTSLPAREKAFNNFMDEFAATVDSTSGDTPLHFAMQKSSSGNDYYFVIKKLIAESDDLSKTNAEGKTFLDEAMDQAVQGNLSPLYCALNCLPQQELIDLVFKKFSTTDSNDIKRLFIQAMAERVIDYKIIDLLNTHAASNEQAREMFSNYVQYATNLDTGYVDQNGNNVMHHIAMMLSDEENETTQDNICHALLSLGRDVRKKLAVPNHDGDTPVVCAADWLQLLLR